MQTGQILIYHRPPWREPEAPGTFEVLYEDGGVVAVGKPSGLPVLPGADYLEHTLLWMVRAHYASQELAPIHRLGRGTSGAMLFARSELARRGLSTDLEHGRVSKRYRALVQGVPGADEFTVSQPIGRLPYPALGYVFGACDDGKPSRSDMRVLERRQATADPADGAHPCTALVQVDIATGRPHQIRIHMAAAGYPLAGEPLYAQGGVPLASNDDRPPLPGDCGYHLHSTRVAFRHPLTQELVTVYCQPPEILRTTGA